MIFRLRLCALCFVVFLIVAGCNFGAKQDSEEQRQRDEKTRDEAAKVTERLWEVGDIMVALEAWEAAHP